MLLSYVQLCTAKQIQEIDEVTPGGRRRDSRVPAAAAHDLMAAAAQIGEGRLACPDHTCHILPPSEIDLGLCLAVFAGSEGRYLFHRIG